MAAEIVDRLGEHFPTLVYDFNTVLFGAATHDLGKVLHPSELTGTGNHHEADGPWLLEENGITPELARFARTHGAWSREQLPLEDLLVALADTVWRGQRLDDLEAQVVARIAEGTGAKPWEVFGPLDELLQEVTSRSEDTAGVAAERRLSHGRLT